MSRLNPKVREMFKSKNPKYMYVFVGYNGKGTYEIKGGRKDNGYILEELITRNDYSLKDARKAIWDYAEIQNGLPVKFN